MTDRDGHLTSPAPFSPEKTEAVDPSASWTEHIHWELMPYTVPIGLLTEGTCRAVQRSAVQRSAVQRSAQDR